MSIVISFCKMKNHEDVFPVERGSIHSARIVSTADCGICTVSYCLWVFRNILDGCECSRNATSAYSCKTPQFCFCTKMRRYCTK